MAILIYKESVLQRILLIGLWISKLKAMKFLSSNYNHIFLLWMFAIKLQKYEPQFIWDHVMPSVLPVRYSVPVSHCSMWTCCWATTSRGATIKGRYAVMAFQTNMFPLKYWTATEERCFLCGWVQWSEELVGKLVELKNCSSLFVSCWKPLPSKG
jgi:hypothetical protein